MLLHLRYEVLFPLTLAQNGTDTGPPKNHYLLEYTETVSFCRRVKQNPIKFQNVVLPHSCKIKGGFVLKKPSIFFLIIAMNSVCFQSKRVFYFALQDKNLSAYRISHR